MAARKSLPIKAICAAYAAGASGRAIASKYGVSHETIFKRLVEAGVLLRDANVPINSPEMDKAILKAGYSGQPISHIAEEYGVSAHTLRNRLIRSGDLTPVDDREEWSADEKAFLHVHYKHDMSAQQIANYLGRTRNEVIGKATRMGLGRATNSAAAMEDANLKPTAMRA